MCGICGTFALNGHLAPDVARAIRPMASALRHRGPDGEGYFTDDRAALGFRRLAIIDRAGGDQPIPNEDRSCWIIFNGEIYNHRALRKTLEQRGHVFRTHADTEAILHAYEEYGRNCVSHLEGMFAFAIYDQRNAEVFLARDRLGKKPLFYALFGDTFHFASEIKGLVPSPCWDGELDLSALEGYFSLGYFLAPGTVFRRVRKLEPGHWLRVHAGGLELQKYWDVEEFDTDDRPTSRLLPELESLLRGAVRERLESEVPLGAFLSGGIDSGLVVSYMAELLGTPVRTTSVGFGEAAHNELDLALLTASRYGTQHDSEVIDPKLDDVFDPIVGTFDEPFADASAIPTYYVSQAARRHVTVALTGDGGDEAFAGYSLRYMLHRIEGHIRRVVPNRIRSRGLAWLASRWPRSAALPRPLRIGTVLENLSLSDADAYYNDLCFLKSPETRALLGLAATRDPRDSPVYAGVTDPYRRCPSKDPVQRALYADLKVYLPNDPLVKVDRMSMAHSLEIRCPLLDRRVIEFAFRVPAKRKMPSLRTKFLLRALARSRLPATVVRQPKHGFSAPAGEWITGQYAQRFQSEVLGPDSRVSSMIDSAFLRSAFSDHILRRRDHSHVLWAAWVLERWVHLHSNRQRLVCQ